MVSALASVRAHEGLAMRCSHKGRQWAGPQLREAKLPPKCRVVREESRHGLRTCRPDPHTGAGHGRGEGHARGPSDSDARPSEWDPSRLGKRVLVLGEPSPAFFRAGPYARASARVKRRMEQVQIPPSGLHPARSRDDRLAVGHVTADVSLFRHHHGCKSGTCPNPVRFRAKPRYLACEEESQQRISTRQAKVIPITPIDTCSLAPHRVYPVFRHPSCLQLPCTHPWYTARPATGHAGGPQATSPLLSSCGRPSAAAALGPPAPTSHGPLRGPGLRGASPQLFTRRTAGAPDAPRGRRRGLHIPALRPVGSAGRMLHQATSSTPDRPLHSPRGRSAAASLPRSSDDPPRPPGHPPRRTLAP